MIEDYELIRTSKKDTIDIIVGIRYNTWTKKHRVGFAVIDSNYKILDIKVFDVGKIKNSHRLYLLALIIAVRYCYKRFRYKNCFKIWGRFETLKFRWLTRKKEMNKHLMIVKNYCNRKKIFITDLMIENRDLISGSELEYKLAGGKLFHKRNGFAYRVIGKNS